MTSKEAFNAEFGAKLQALREERGWSRAQLAERSGVRHRTIAGYEQAQWSASWQNVCLLAAALGVSTEELRP